MKHVKKLSLIITVAVVCAVFFMLSPLSASAESYGTIVDMTGEVFETVSDTNIYFPEQSPNASIYSNGVTISLDDAEGTVYNFEVATSGRAYSSFKLQLAMPDFIDVIEIVPTDSLLSLSKNGVFESNISDNTVNVSFSSPTNFSDIVLFSVNFTVNDYSEQTATIECYEYQLVNENIELVGAAFDLGHISITESIMMGDVNADLTVNLMDLLIIQRSLVNEEFPLNETQYRAADIDRNGVVDMIDCQYIQLFLVGRIGSLEDVTACSHEKIHIEEREPSCTQEGYYKKFCGVCGEIFFEEYYAPYGHNFDESGVCVNCGAGADVDEELQKMIDEAVMNFTEIWNSLPEQGVSAANLKKFQNQYLAILERMQNADCIETLDKYQNQLNDLINRILQTVEPDVCYHENTYGESQEPTCTEGGYYREICENCGTIVSERVSAPYGHAFDESGVCVNCGEKTEIGGDESLDAMIAQAVTLANESWNRLFDMGVSASIIKAYEAQYFAIVEEMTKSDSVEMLEGYLWQLEDLLNKILETVEPDVCKHEYTYEERIEPTCTVSGVIREVCADCGTMIYEKYTPSYGHNFDENGVCMNCGEASGTEEKKALYFYESKELTLLLYADETAYFTELVYTADGMVYKKEGEGYWYMTDGMIFAHTESGEHIFTVMAETGELIPYEKGDDVVEPTVCPHEDIYIGGTEPTCTENGLVTNVCMQCGEVLFEDYLPPYGHKFDEYGMCTICGEKVEGGDGVCEHGGINIEDREPTCTENGYHREICADCGMILYEDYMPAYGHDLGENGVCYMCGEKIEGGDGVCKHEKVYADERESTCTESGFIRKICAICNEVLSNEELPPYGHVFSEDGICYNCGEIDVNIDRPFECYHENTYTDGIGATCTESGLIRFLCWDCGMVLSEHYEEALGHRFDENGVCTNCGEMTEVEGGEREILYTYASKELILYLYSDHTAEYNEFIYTSDGSVITTQGIGKWYMADGAVIYAYTESGEHVFLVMAETGELVRQ